MMLAYAQLNVNFNSIQAVSHSSGDIVALIGVGGMREVYKARDPRLDHDVAIKVLPPELASKAAMVQRFQREARAVAAVNHPSIVTIYSVEEADGLRFLTMELVEGQSLDRLIPASGMEVERILTIADALSGALPHGKADVSGGNDDERRPDAGRWNELSGKAGTAGDWKGQSPAQFSGDWRAWIVTDFSDHP